MNGKKYERLDETSLDFTTIAEKFGYRVDKTRSSKKITILVSESKRLAVYDNGSKGHFYINQKDSNEKGSIIDLVKRELGCDFLRAKDFITGAQIAPLSPRTEAPEWAEEGKKDFDGAYSKSKYPNESAYLTEVRGIAPEVLALSADTRQGTDTNLFYHRDSQGRLTGYEYRDEKRKGFAKGGAKSLFSIWGSDEVKSLIIVESAINALSYMQILLLKDDLKEAYLHPLIVSTAGRSSQSQKDHIKALADRYKPEFIILGQDNDKGGDGDKQADELKAVLNEFKTIRHKPQLNDWNDELNK